MTPARECEVCGDTFVDAPGEYNSIRTHVQNSQDHPAWREYLVVTELHPCPDCGRPLDTVTLDRCYTCRVRHEFDLDAHAQLPDDA